MKKVLYLSKSITPFYTQRRDVDYIIENLLNEGYDISIYDLKAKNLFHINSKTNTSYNPFPKLFYISKLSLLLNFICFILFCLKNKKMYDIVQINYVRAEYLIIPGLINKLGKKLQISLFGSDINERNIVKDKFTKLYKYADKIIATNATFLQKANTLIKDVDILAKSSVIILPQDHFKLYYDFEINQKTESKSKMGINPALQVITVGTNYSPNEQHEAIIVQLQELENKDQYHLIFNISNRYNTISERAKMLMDLINTSLSEFKFTINSTFLSFEEVATLRHATDIFINLRKNDQLAASMLESNLSYSEVITGTWLPYTDYKKSINVHCIDKISGLNKKIYELSTINEQNLVDNRNKVIEKYDSGVIDQWIQLFDEKK